jgi:hypothetical protein
MSGEVEPTEKTGGDESVPGFEEFGAVEPDARAELERKDYAKGDERRHEKKTSRPLHQHLGSTALCLYSLHRISDSNFSFSRSAMLVLA